MGLTSRCSALSTTSATAARCKTESQCSILLSDQLGLSGAMYLISIILLLLVLPAGSVAIEALIRGGGFDIVGLVGKWFAFWGVGMRLFLAGIRQTLRPQFTAEDIFALKDPAVHPLVREIGFGNLAMGALGLLSLAFVGLVVPAAIVGGLYYGLAGLGHLVRGHRNAAGQIAMISDFLMLALLAIFVALRGP